MRHVSEFVISKTFEFDFAHRVPTQNIIKDLCTTCRNKCKKIHGHTGRVEVQLSAKRLDRTGMVTDYTNLKWFKNYIIDAYFDHKLILSIKYDTLWRTLIKYAPEQIDKFVLNIYRPRMNKIKILTFNDRKKLIEFLTNKTKPYELISLYIPTEFKEKELNDYVWLLRSFTLINNYTTAETLALVLKKNLQIFFDKFFNPKFKQNVKVKRVCFFETPDSSACV
jgi:6-pyruvoyl tetrahydropterin synthase/QueD family protein